MLKTVTCERDSIVQPQAAGSATRTNAEADKPLMFRHQKHAHGVAGACREHKPRVYMR